MTMVLCLLMLLQVHEPMVQRKRAIQSKVRRGATSQWHSLTRHMLVAAGLQVATFTHTSAQVYAYCRWYAEQNSGSRPELLRALDAMTMEEFPPNGQMMADLHNDPASIWWRVFPHHTPAWRVLATAFCQAASKHTLVCLSLPSTT